MTWHVVPHKEAAFTLAQLPAEALAGVPHKRATVKGKPLTLIRHTQQTYDTLRERGLLLPSPAKHYRYIGRFPPMSHQRSTVEFFVQHRKCCCLNGLGTGKSLSATWAMDYLFDQGAVRRVLIVAPLSICEHVWERELFQTLPHRTSVVLRGNRQRKQQIAADTRFDILIVNPESLHLLEGHLPMVDLIVVDEFTKFKNARSQRWRALKRLSQGTRLWLMSGTPAPQSPLDAYGPYRLVVQGRPMSYTQWRELTMYQVSQFRWIARDGAEETVAKYLQPAIRYKREDCYDLPEVQELYLDVDLTAQQTQLIEAFRKEAAAMVEEHEITAPNAAAILLKVLQVMSGGVYGHDADGARASRTVDASPLMEAVEEIVEQADTPVLVFVPFRAAVGNVAQHLEKAGYRVGVIHGGVHQRERAPLFDALQEGTIDALVAVAGTMSHGLTLTASRYVVWLQPPFSYEEYEQANGRVIRKGQRNNVVIYHIVQNRLARSLFDRLKSKARLQDAVLNLISGGGK